MATPSAGASACSLISSNLILCFISRSSFSPCSSSCALSARHHPHSVRQFVRAVRRPMLAFATTSERIRRYRKLCKPRNASASRATSSGSSCPRVSPLTSVAPRSISPVSVFVAQAETTMELSHAVRRAAHHDSCSQCLLPKVSLPSRAPRFPSSCSPPEQLFSQPPLGPDRCRRHLRRPGTTNSWTWAAPA